MNSFSFAIRSLMRDLKAGELWVLLVAIVVAVAAMTAVGFFTDRVGRAIKEQASAVLAGDLVVSSPAPIDKIYVDSARAAGLEATEALSFLTMVLSGQEGNALTMITAVAEGYPLRGELLVSDAMYGDPRAAVGVPPPGTAWAEPGMLGRLDIDVGAIVAVGDAKLRVTQVLEYQPAQNSGGFTNLAPGMLVNIQDVPSFNVIRPGSRATYRNLYAGPDGPLASFRSRVEKELVDSARVRGVEDAGEQINAAIDRAQRFLTLASLVTVILAAVATAMSARRYALRHMDTIALLKSMGATQGFVQNATLIQLVLVILGTTAIGSLIGFVAQGALVGLAAEFLKVELPGSSARGVLLGLITAGTITIGFALPHLLALKTTPPIRVLRHDLPPPPLRSSMTYGVAVAALILMIYVLVRDVKIVGLISLGLMGVTAASVGCGWLLVRSFTQFRGAAGVAWRYGLANISRRGRESVVQIVAFSLSLTVLLLLTVVRNDLLTEWQRTLPDDAPNYFLINIQPELWPDVQGFLNEEMDAEAQYLPFIRSRISRLKGQSVVEYDFPGELNDEFVRRDTNLTWQGNLPESNRVVAGEWWGEEYSGAIQISLDAQFARRLGLDVGDMMGFDVGGEFFEAPVTSLRTIEWDSMAPNFYVMLSPGQAADLPQSFIASVFVPPERRRLLNKFVREFPSVTVIDLAVILGQVRMIIERATMSVQYVFLFTLFAGIVVLLAAVQATRDERRFESAILHTLGAHRNKILQGVAVEFTALGSLAGILAAFGATVVGYFMAERVFELSYTISPSLWLLGLVVGSVIVGLTGTIATRKAVNEPPVVVLREQ